MTGRLLVAALLLLPLAGAAAVLGLRDRRRALGLAAAGAMAATAALALALAAAGATASWAWGGGLEIRLAADGAARVMAPLVPLVAGPVLLYATGHEERGLARLLAWLLAFVGAMELLVLAADLLTLLVGFELVGVCSWALIGHTWEEGDTTRAASRAFLTVRGGDLGLYLAAGGAFAATGSLAFDSLPTIEGPLLHVVAAGILLAAAAKSAQLPFSPWLFDAMAGPTPASALLHSATMVAAGAYTLARLAPAFEATGWFPAAVVTVGLTTALAAGLVAALHPEIKQALAASTSAQYGLMLVAIGTGSAATGVAHLVAHAFFKSLLFLGAGIAIHAAGTGRLDRMRLGTALPRAAWLFGIGAAALAAIPPLGAAWTKEEVVNAAGAASAWLAMGVIAAGLVSALYATRLHLLAFGPGEPSEIRERPARSEMIGAGILAAGTVALAGLWLPGAERIVEAVAGGRLPAGRLWETLASLGAVAAGVGLATSARRRRALFRLGLPAGAARAAEAWLGIPALTRRGVAAPTLALANALADFDRRVVDAGVRLAARFGDALGRALSWWSEAGFDGAVRAVARGALQLAVASRVADDRGVDASVEATAAGIGATGRASRRIQTGSAHHYLAILFAGLLAAVTFALLGR